MKPAIDLPYLLALAVVLPVVFVFLVVGAYRRRRARLARLGTASMVARLVPPNAAVRASCLGENI